MSGVAVGRNDPCPCGSGRRYKHCHGALGEAPALANDDAEVKEGLAAHQSGDLVRAEAAYRRVLARAADHPVATHYLGVLHYQRGRWDDALPLLERAAEAVPHEPEYHNNLGLALAALDRGEEAVAAYRRALALKPEHAVAWNNLGLALTARNRLEEAIASFRQAIAQRPQFGEAHWNLALALLGAGHFEEGWREYEWRLRIAQLGGAAPTSRSTAWDGTIRPGKTLLLAAEQGLGDAIQFARFAQPIAAGGMRVELEAPAPLQRLLASVPGVERVHRRGAAPVDADFALPLLSVAGVLGVGSHAIPAETPYVFADPDRRARMRTALERYRAKRRIGLVWAGNPGHANDRRRSIPFPALEPLLAVPHTAWFSLQKDSTIGTPLIEWPERDTLDDLAALVAELDLIVSVDTSIAHLAGALNRPTWVLLPYAPDWRWGLERSDSPWYPTVRLFRQARPGDWAGVLAEVATALQS